MSLTGVLTLLPGCANAQRPFPFCQINALLWFLKRNSDSGNSCTDCPPPLPLPLHSWPVGSNWVTFLVGIRGKLIYPSGLTQAIYRHAPLPLPHKNADRGVINTSSYTHCPLLKLDLVLVSQNVQETQFFHWNSYTSVISTLNKPPPPKNLFFQEYKLSTLLQVPSTTRMSCSFGTLTPRLPPPVS